MTTVLERPTALKQSKSALHVEDDRTWQRMIGRYLQETGYDVVWTDNLQDAQTHVERQKFDLYVVDGNFPRRQGERPVPDTGIELYNFVMQTHGKDAKYVFVSSDPELELLCHERGVTFFNKDRFTYGSFMSYFKNQQ